MLLGQHPALFRTEIREGPEYFQYPVGVATTAELHMRSNSARSTNHEV